MKTTYGVTFEGQTHTRKSKSAYTHATVYRAFTGSTKGEMFASFHKSLEAAQKGSLAPCQREWLEIVAVLPVEIV